MADAIKLCRDCKHARPDRSLFARLFGETWNFAKCAAEPDPVTGAPAFHCSTQRKDYGNDASCGKAGKWWEVR